MENIQLRTFFEDDYEEVISLWKMAGIKLSLSDGREELLKLAFKTENKFIILEDDKKIIGAVICAHDGRRGYIHHLTIHPDYQKQRLGKYLMEQAINHYRSLETVKTHIFIEKTNIDVVDFYKKQGWEVRDDIVLMTLTMRNE